MPVKNDPSFGRAIDTRDAVEDGGLPRAVGADEPGPRSGEDLEAGIVEEDLTAMLAGDVGQVNHAFESPSIKNHRGRSLWSLLH